MRQRMGELLSRLDDSGFQRFDNLFDISEGRLGIVVTFLAMLELAKEMLVEIVQEAATARRSTARESRSQRRAGRHRSARCARG